MESLKSPLLQDLKCFTLNVTVLLLCFGERVGGQHQGPSMKHYSVWITVSSAGSKYNTILYFKITHKYVVIEKKETQRLALYQGYPKEKRSFEVTIKKLVNKNMKKSDKKEIIIINKYKMAVQ